MLYLMAIGSPTQPIAPDAWYWWCRDWNIYREYTFLGRVGLFTHQYSHAWVDFRHRREIKADAFNPNMGWVNPDVIGINVGITLLSAENLRAGSVWGWFMRNQEIPRAMEMVGLRLVGAHAPQNHPSLTPRPQQPQPWLNLLRDGELGVASALGVVTDPDSNECRLDDLFHVDVPECQFLFAQGEFHALGFPRAQRDPLKPFQFTDRPSNRGASLADVQLRHFDTVPAAHVLHLHRHP